MAALPFGWRIGNAPEKPSRVQELLNFARQLGAQGGPSCAQDDEELRRLLGMLCWLRLWL